MGFHFSDFLGVEPKLSVAEVRKPWGGGSTWLEMDVVGDTKIFLDGLVAWSCSRWR